MKSFNRFTTFFFAIALAGILGCASTSTKEGTGEYFDDSVVTAKVKAALFNEPTLSSGQISVETFKGTVQLSGFVKTPQEKGKAAEVARTVNGVASVKNNIQLRQQ
jgi:osmotically-inducible protein OsmY